MSIELQCKREGCGHVWTYKGKQTFWASCPKCKTSVRVEHQKEAKKVKKDDKGRQKN